MQPYTPSPKKVVLLFGRFVWVCSDRCLPKTVEDTDILPKATPDLRAYNPDACPILGCPRNSRKFLCYSEGGRPLVGYPSTLPT